MSSNTNAMKQLRGPKHENWPVCDPRAGPPGECGLKSGESGHLARTRKWGDRWPILLTSLAQCVWKAVGAAGWSGWWVLGRSCTRAHTRRVGRFVNSSGLVKRAVSGPSGAAPEGCARGVWVTSPVPGRARGNKAVAFHNLQAFSKCARRRKP
jgi:hypothetical protein